MNYSIDKKLYNEILNYLSNQYFVEIRGVLNDLNFLIDDLWMRDTAVIENIEYRRGEWKIFLVFSHYKNPLLLIRREISVCFELNKAKLYGEYMRRIAAKDPRGTLLLDIDDFELHHN